jgi:glyoxylase-like metal-dependent hydrolase (beta-lactamase superfamily II)
MLKPVTDGILIHQSKFLQSNATVVQGHDGVLLIDPGITTDELVCLAADLAKLGQPVVAGFSTHPHWDHLLWHPRLGNAVRYGTDVCVADIQAVLSSPDWKDKVARVLPPDIADEIPMDGLGRITGLPKGAATIPWDGPEVQIIEHQAHAAGHAALLVKDLGVLIAGDMLSDILMPMLNLEAEDPMGDYLSALDVLEGNAADVEAVVPGHGAVGHEHALRDRIKQDRTYVEALRDGRESEDSRISPSAKFGQIGIAQIHKWQLGQLQKRQHRD